MSDTIETQATAPSVVASGARRSRRSFLRDPAGRATTVAGCLLVAGLALAVGQAGSATLTLTLAAAGTVTGAFALGPSTGRAVKRHSTLAAVGVLGLCACFLTLLSSFAGGTGDPLYALSSIVVLLLQLAVPAVVLAAGVGGVVLLADAMRGRRGRGDRLRTPWQRLTMSGPANPEAGSPSPWQILAGLALVAGSAVIGLAVAYTYLGSSGVTGLLLLLLVGGAGLLAVVVPVLVSSVVRADRDDAAGAREDERQRIAAHLHDSVLQTLALVQRQAADPGAVVRLARRQEHDLRAWMAGEAELGSETLAATLRGAVGEVEEEHGTVVEITVLGDRPLDPAGEALAAAAREALRNAARHAPGASVFVFAQADPDGAEVFIRDEGAGFELASVPTERRGVRDAIVGRMAAAGGRATVESVPGEGTEVVLRIGVTGHGA